MTMRRNHILLLQGPNMNWLGLRQPEYYGRTTADELDQICRQHAERNGYRITIVYENSEGRALDRIYELLSSDDPFDGIVMNPAAWSLAGMSMRYCLQGIDKPYVEVHLRNQYCMKVVSTLADLAIGVVQGFGINSYILGLNAMHTYLNEASS